ncbi:MAG: hypothetical protein JWR21_3469 [Herminiimonas sp.]|nr:hypothetical protein [Herminiimonas sp.]
MGKRHPLHEMDKHSRAMPDQAAQVASAFMKACDEFVTRFSMAPDKLQARVNAGLAEYQEYRDYRERPEYAVMGRAQAEAGRNDLRNTVFPRRDSDRRPPSAADAKIQAFTDFAAELAERRDIDAAARFLTRTRNSEGPRAADAREFAAKFYEAARGDIDLLVRNGGGLMYLLAGCLVGKSTDEMFASPLLAMLGPHVKAYVGALAAVETKAPVIASRWSIEDS